MKIKIPKDYPVRPLKPGQEAKDRFTCGTCDLSWDDAISTSMTPVPAGRCPFEAFHPDEEDAPRTSARTDASTPTPRVMKKSYANDVVFYIGGFGQNRKAAEDALRAVNAHGELVDALKRCRDFWQAVASEDELNAPEWLDEVIAKAEARS